MKPINSHQNSSAIVPNIFDAFANTDFLLPLVLGNLLSSRLWDLSGKIQEKLASTSEISLGSRPSADDPLRAVRAIQRQLDRHFTHLNAGIVSVTFGELSLVDERQRLGEDLVNNAVELIKGTFLQRLEEQTLPAEAVSALISQIEQDRFPAYFYKTFDVVLANRTLTGRRTNAPMGLTSCLDEVAIFAALVMTMPEANVERIIVLASAAHYSAFGWTSEGETWWLYGKNNLLTMHDWQELVEQKFQGDCQRAFDCFLGDMDRIVCSSGLFDLKTGKTEIPDTLTAEIIQKLDVFFGSRIVQLSNALALPVSRTSESPLAPILRELLGSKSLEHARARLVSDQVPNTLSVLYSYRSLEVPDIYPYLATARHQPLCKVRASALHSCEDAIALIRLIKGKESIFGDRSRIAMPDETLSLETGTDRDKALLLHVLLEHLNLRQHHQMPILTRFTNEDSFVCHQDACFSLRTLNDTEPPVDGVLWQFSSFAE